MKNRKFKIEALQVAITLLKREGGYHTTLAYLYELESDLRRMEEEA